MEIVKQVSHNEIHLNILATVIALLLSYAGDS